MYECSFVSDLNTCPYRMGALCQSFEKGCSFKVEPPVKVGTLASQAKGYVRKERWYEKYYEARERRAKEGMKREAREEKIELVYDESLDPMALPKGRKQALERAVWDYYFEFGEHYPGKLEGRIDSAGIIKEIYECIRTGRKK